MDALHYKVREDEKVVSRAVYNILGVNNKGIKDLLGMYVSESEGARFWLQVLNDLKARGVEDILISSIDNLKGFKEAIETTFPATDVQSCIVHQIDQPGLHPRAPRGRDGRVAQKPDHTAAG